VNCYSCDAAAINVCKRCSRPYCADHGNALYCSDCLKPESALPSFNLYRGALLLMLVGTALAVVLIVRPPGETKGAAPVIAGKVTPTATASGGTAVASVTVQTPDTTTTPGTTTPIGDQTTTPAADTTVAASETAGPVGTPTAAYRTYTVQDGDSIASIAEQLVSPGDNLSAFEDAIITLNNLQGPDPILHPGQQLLIPPLP
jgi:LysM repeat protein